MMVEMKEELKKELKRGYKHFGYDDSYAEERINDDWSAIKVTKPKRIKTNNGSFNGYKLTVHVITDADIETKKVMRDGTVYYYRPLRSIDLIVTENEFKYVISTCDTYLPENGDPYDDMEFENEQNIEVNLEDLNPNDYL